MADIPVAITKISDKVLELRAISKGVVYTHRYLGYSTKQAITHFEKWLKSQETL